MILNMLLVYKFDSQNQPLSLAIHHFFQSHYHHMLEGSQYHVHDLQDRFLPHPFLSLIESVVKMNYPGVVFN